VNKGFNKPQNTRHFAKLADVGYTPSHPLSLECGGVAGVAAQTLKLDAWHRDCPYSLMTPYRDSALCPASWRGSDAARALAGFQAVPHGVHRPLSIDSQRKCASLGPVLFRGSHLRRAGEDRTSPFNGRRFFLRPGSPSRNLFHNEQAPVARRSRGKTGARFSASSWGLRRIAAQKGSASRATTRPTSDQAVSEYCSQVPSLTAQDR
jgi:hypothetical protein